MALKCQKIFITYGRFQPVTWGHENSFNAIKKKASENGCPYRIFVSHTNDTNKNPLKQLDKIKWMKIMLGEHANNIMGINPSNPQKCVRYCMKKVNGVIPEDYDECVYMVGSDRVNAMQYLHKYNGCNPNRTSPHKAPDFSMKHFEVVSTGQRDADGKTFSISGTKMRNWARSGDIKEFKKGLPKSNNLSEKHILEFMALL